jgi:two-component system phosphate regulon sensor histidine kinase PhoR
MTGLYNWIAIITSGGSAVLLVRTGWTVYALSRRGKGLTPVQGRLFLGLTLLLLFVVFSVTSNLVRRGSGSPEFLLVSVLVLSCCLSVAIVIQHHGRLEALVERRTSELITANVRLQSLLDNMPAGVVFARAPFGEPLLVNRKATEMLGVPTGEPDRPLPADAAVFRRRDGEAYPIGDLPLSRTLRTGEPTSADDLVIQRPGQERMKIFMTASPVLDENGMMTSAICVFQDVSERERLQELRESLMHIIVHDLRNPMHAIAGYLELLAESGYVARHPDAQEYFRHVRTNCQSLVNMTTALLDLSRMEAGQIQLNIKELQLRDVWVEAEAETASLARLKGLKVSVRIPPRLTAVSADRSMLRRVLVNLMTNAICFAPLESKITVSARREGDIERVAIGDQGPGIAPEFHELIFKKSGRVESGAKATYFSTGLGLAFCKMAVELQGGTIGLESEVGRGSTFWFTVPVAEQRG